MRSSYWVTAMTEDLVEKARMAEHAERFEDMARVWNHLKPTVIIIVTVIDDYYYQRSSWNKW